MKIKIYLQAFFKNLPYKKALGLFVMFVMNPALSYGFDGGLPIFLTGNFLCPTPDTVYEDTLEYDNGDTLSVLEDGLDTIYVLFTDSSLSADDSFNFRTANSNIDIGVTLGSTAKVTEPGQYGFGIEGFFTENHFSSNSTINTEGWQWLSDLYPQTIRFPGGANGKFMHLLPYRDLDNNEVLDPVSGYGYDMEEIIRFYDVTDGIINAPLWTDVDPGSTSISEDLEDGICDNCEVWMETDYTPNLERYYELSLNDQSVPLGPNQRYIDQFIAMINEIQSQNDYLVDVILDLNIVTETAPQCRAIVEYLRDNGVNVIGVEMGNEANLRWAVDLMGFDSFNKYWLFIN